MKTTNMFRKIKYLFLAVAFCLIAAIAFIVPSSLKVEKDAKAADGLTFTSYSSLSQIKTNAANKEFIVYGVISNNSESLFGVDFQINIDSNVFEFKEYMTPAKIAAALSDSSLSNALNATENVTRHTDTSVVCSVDNNFQPITASTFVIGGYKIAVKSGATLSGSSTVTVTGVKIPNMLGQAVTFTSAGTSMSISFVPPSTACDITNLTSTQSGVTITKDGSNFKAEVPYSVSTLNTSNSILKATVSAGATATYSPSNPALTVGQTQTITITVTAEDGVTKKTATLSVTRKADEEAKTLSALTFKNGSTELLSKSASDLASGGDFNIEDEIAYADKDNLSVTTSKNGTYSTVQISVDGTSKYSGAATEANKTQSLSGLAAGDHTLTVTVKSETGESTQYTVKFKIAEDSSGTGPINPTNPTNPSNPTEPGLPDENGAVFKPTLKSNPTFTGKPIDIKSLLDGFNSTTMEISGDATVTKAGSYSVTITLKDAAHTWKDKPVNAAKNIGLVVPLADGASFSIPFEIQPYKIPATAWKNVNGGVPKLDGVPADILGYISFEYTNKDGETVALEDMVVGEEYTATPVLEGDGAGSITFEEATHAFSFTEASFFMRTFFGLKVWLWFVIGGAVLIALIILIAVICSVAKKRARNAEKRAEQEELKEERKAQRRRKEEEHEARIAAMANSGNNAVSMPMMGGVLPVGIQQQPASSQPIVVNSSTSSEQLSDIKQELREMREAMRTQSAQPVQSVQPVQAVAAQPSTSSEQLSDIKQELREMREAMRVQSAQPVQPVQAVAAQPSASSEQLSDIKQELRDLRRDLRSQPVQPVAAQPIMAQPMVAQQPVAAQPVAAQPEKTIVVTAPAPANESVSAAQIKDEVKGDLKEEFGHQARVEQLLATIATMREQDRQKLGIEEQERNERLQSLEMRRREQLEASEYHHTPYEVAPRDFSGERIRELEGKLRNMEELMWMMRFGGMQQLQQPQQAQQPQQPLADSAKDSRVQELESKIRELEAQRNLDARLKEIELKQEIQRENEKRAREEEQRLHDMEMKQMELMRMLEDERRRNEEERRRNDEERRLREMEERLNARFANPPQPTVVTVQQPQQQKVIKSVQRDKSSAGKPKNAVQQPAHPASVQPGSVMTTTTTTTIDATKDAKASDLPDYTPRFTARRRP
ncbi:MAG: hypothetical protein K2G44_01695 [Clostridia bacterium]|nr:hypothetical protein [Clostridia bacterium]